MAKDPVTSMSAHLQQNRELSNFMKLEVAVSLDFNAGAYEI